MIEVEPELAIPLPALDKKETYLDLQHRMNSLCNTAVHLKQNGLAVDKLTREEKLDAGKIVSAYSENTRFTSTQVNTRRAATLTPQAIIYTTAILNEFGHAVAESATKIRHLVTNKLIHETESKDARVRLKALELLGKLSDVGLFSEKSEMTITHQTTDDIKQKLRDKLERLVNPEIEDAVLVTAEGEEIEFDIDAELGLK